MSIQSSANPYSSFSQETLSCIFAALRQPSTLEGLRRKTYRNKEAPSGAVFVFNFAAPVIDIFLRMSGFVNTGTFTCM